MTHKKAFHEPTDDDIIKIDLKNEKQPSKMNDTIYINNEKGLKDNVGIVYMSKTFKDALAYLGVNLIGRNLNSKDTMFYIAERLGIPLKVKLPIGEINYKNEPMKRLKEYIFNQVLKKNDIAKMKDKKAEELGNQIKIGRKTKKTQSKKFKGFVSYKHSFINEDGELERLWEEIQEVVEETGADTITTNVIIYFRKIGTNKVIATEVNMEEIKTPPDFAEWIQNIRSGNIVGSDARSEDEYDLILDYFSVNTYDAIGLGNSTYIVWETEEEQNINGRDCAKNAMRKCGYCGEADNLKSLPNLLKKIIDEQLPIRVVKNIPEISHKLFTQLNERYIQEQPTIPKCSTCCERCCSCENGYEYIIDENHKYLFGKNPHASPSGRKMNKKYQLALASHYAEEFRYKTIYECEDYEYTIIYCEYSKHFSVAKDNKLVFKPTIWFNHYKTFNNSNLITLKQGSNPHGFFENGIVARYDRPPPTKKFETEWIVEEAERFKYLIFDFETIVDFDDDSNNNLMRPYSMSVLLLSPTEMESLEKFDKENNKKECEEIRSKCAKTFIGFDCVRMFFTWLGSLGKGTNYRFCGFNNSNFDNYFIFNELMKNEYIVEVEGDIQPHLFKVYNYLFSGSSLLSLCIEQSSFGDNNFASIVKHDFFDLAKHLVGSLDNNCKGWKVNCCSKLSFNHYKAQVLYDTSPQSLLDFCNRNEELKTYNEFDCMSVAVIIQRYKNTLNTIPCVIDFLKTYEDHKQKQILAHNSIPCITTRPTIGGLVYGIFKNECKKKEIKFAKLPTFVYNEIMRCKVAGRVEMFNGVKKIEERMASLDVCSLYPYVLAVAPVYYPCGGIIWEKDFAGFDKFGFYWVSFTQDLRERNLPNIYPLKTETENDWNSEGRIENVLLSTTTIKLLEDYGVEYEFVEQTPTASTDTFIGFTFSEYRKSCDMFEFVLEIMKLKNEQDTLKQIGDKSYNAPLRETLKLLMNAVSGKVIEDYHTESTLTFDTNEEFWEEISKVEPNEILAGEHMPYKSINCVNMYGDRLVCRFETHKRVLQENSKKEQRPIYLGSALYDYAKAHMYRHSYSQIGLDKLVYTDTDATKTTYSNFEVWRKYAENTIVPHHKEVEEYDPRYATHKLYDPHSKVFGSFEDELEECKSSEYEFYCLQKKCWLYRYGSNNKFRFKGVNGRSCPISNYDLKNLEWVEERQVKNMVSKEVKISYGVRADKGRLVNDYHNTHTEKHLGVGLNATKFFRALYEDKKAYVLCSSFRKHANNTIMSIEDGVFDMNKTNNNFACIEQVYTLKQITLK